MNEQKKTKKQSKIMNQLKSIFTPKNIITISLVSIGILILLAVASVIWTDTIYYQKDITTIFFEDRSKQLISLGLGLQLIHYHLLSIGLIATGISIHIITKK